VVILAPPGGDFRPTPRLEVGALVVWPAREAALERWRRWREAYALTVRDAE
jgi:hypothetical protein